MRWLFGFLLALTLAGAAYALSPYYALYRLTQAIEARDTAALSERVNFRAVRASVARELVTAYLAATGRAEEAKGLRGQVVVGAGVSLADRMLARYATPEDLLALLKSNPSGAGSDAGAAADLSTSPLGALTGEGSAILSNAWELFAGAEATGFRAVSFGLPPRNSRDSQYRLQFRINSSLTWRLVGIQLPRAVQQRLVQEFIRSNPTQGLARETQ